MLSRSAVADAVPMRTWAVLAVVSVCASLIAAPAGWAAAAPTRAGYAKVLEACPAAIPGHAKCFALVREPVAAPAAGEAAPPGAQPFVAGGGAAAAGPAGGLTPEDLASAYGYIPGASGAGQTVGIVDAFDDPSIESDLAEFDAHYGLPACNTANGCFKKVGQTGTSSLPQADKTGWSIEITLDVETVHATCPNCRILLVEANSTSFADLGAAVNQAVALGATEVSNSYGGLESSPKAAEWASYNHPGIPIVASTGDDGYYGWDSVNEGDLGDEMPSFPSSLSSTVAVGGTKLELNPDGSRANETVWNNNGPGDDAGLESEEPEGATGGGCSKVFTAQPWQHAVSNFAASGCGEKRLAADVSAVADPLTGFDIYDTFICGAKCEFPRVAGGWATFGGTSLSAPFISALYALAGGGDGVSYPALTLYGHAGDASLRFDVAEGGNGFCGGEPTAECGKPNLLFGDVDCEGTTACNAVSGFDGPSGIGTPRGLGLFTPLLPSAGITAPGALTAGTAAGFSAGSSSDPYPGGSIAGASWSWGDGTSGTGISATHAFAAAGTYTVSLKVNDAYGLSSPTVATTVNVGAPPVSGGSAGAVQASLGSPPSPDARLAKTVLRASRSGAVTVRIACPTGVVRCRGTLTLRTLTAVRTGVASASKKKAILTLAKASFSVAGGRTAAVTLHLTLRARALLARRRTLHVVATIVSRDIAGVTRTTKPTLTLRAPRGAHRKH